MHFFAAVLKLYVTVVNPLDTPVYDAETFAVAR
jgi:hypothetical protein